MPEIIENHAPQWSEKTLLKRIQQMMRGSEATLSLSELPLSIHVPHFLERGKIAFSHDEADRLSLINMSRKGVES